MNANSRQDVYTRVTDKIIADLEHGVRSWVQPWREGADVAGLPLRHDGTPYRGINVLLLWSGAIEKGYRSPRWMTYRQACELGGQVRRGESGSLVVYAKNIAKTDATADGETVERDIYLMRGYTVFNVEQIDGLPPTHGTPTAPIGKPVELVEETERFFAATGATVRHGGSEAFYSPARDVIQLPHPQDFDSADSYAATKAHELTHWTRHPSRLDRDLGRQRVGDEGYAREELVAELGAAFLCAFFGIRLQPREDHAAYIAGWLKVLKSDKRAIFAAAAQAQRAVDYLHSLQPAAAV